MQHVCHCDNLDSFSIPCEVQKQNRERGRGEAKLWRMILTYSGKGLTLYKKFIRYENILIYTVLMPQLKREKLFSEERNGINLDHTACIYLL